MNHESERFLPDSVDFEPMLRHSAPLAGHGGMTPTGTHIDLGRAMRAELSDGLAPALELLASMPDEAEPLPADTCVCGTTMRAGDYLFCERCARDRGLR